MKPFLSNRLTPWIDPRVLTVRVRDVQAYLQRRGWQPRATRRPHTLLFEAPADAGTEPDLCNLPDSERYSDYYQRIIEIITDLAVREDRYAGEVLTDMLQPAAPQMPSAAPPSDGGAPAVPSSLSESKPL